MNVSVVFLALALPAALPAMTEEGQCAMRVLERYCLGGLSSSLPRSKAIQEGEQPGVVFRTFDGGEAVATYNGRIYKVTKVYPMADFKTYHQVCDQLTEHYGEEIDQLKIFHFPPSAEGEPDRLEAIRTGQATIQHVWRVPGIALISLLWDGPELGISYESPAFGPQEAHL